MPREVAGPLTVAPYRSQDDPLHGLGEVGQAAYLGEYLDDLGAATVVVEPAYFDRDYLSEFAAFYCTSAAGHPNVCRRLHYFSARFDRSRLELAVGGDQEAREDLERSYLGFVVLRPIPSTPLGRTVLRWYDDKSPRLPRVVEPSRDYACHVSGLRWVVRGVAWQQQDAAVGACATVALWSLLHASAFDERHVVPTTAEVTSAANGPGLSAYRAFPSRGLTSLQLVGAIRAFSLAPVVVTPDRVSIDGRGRTFSREHFSASMASFVRSGYPVLLGGTLLDEQATDGPRTLGEHAVCVVGFRQAGPRTPGAGEILLEDASTEFVYVHDDNLGPAARFCVAEDGASVVLRRSRPGEHAASPRDASFRPTVMVAAVQEDVRLSPSDLYVRALSLAADLVCLAGKELGLTIGTRFSRLSRYVGDEIGKVLRSQPSVLAHVRLSLWEDVAPLPLHVGVIRFGFGQTVLMDVLVDTTDSEPNTRAFCHVVYHKQFASLVDELCVLQGSKLGPKLVAF